MWGEGEDLPGSSWQVREALASAPEFQRDSDCSVPESQRDWDCSFAIMPFLELEGQIPAWAVCSSCSTARSAWGWGHTLSSEQPGDKAAVPR